MFASGKSASVSTVANYIEDVFSTYLYTGNGSTQTITNGIDLSTKGGLIWQKARSDLTPSGNVGYHHLVDTVRGNASVLDSSSSGAAGIYATPTITSFNTDGFGLTSFGSGGNASWNSAAPFYYVSWTFRNQPKFFDVVTYTGTGANTTIAHSLGSVPGCMIIKATSGAAQDWAVYHQSLGNDTRILLNTTDAAINVGSVQWNSTTPTSSVFSLGTNSTVNGNGVTYVAYIFAHNAGGFGLTGSDNVISCGSFTYSNSAGVSVTLGYEPQWIMYKSSTALGGGTNWIMHDMMRGMPVPTATTATLAANNSGAENSSFARAYPTATGFALPSGLGADDTYIYIAIRRGPMKVPTTGTSVYNGITRTGTGASAEVTGAGFSPDLAFIFARDGTRNPSWQDKLRGKNQELISATTAAELAISESVMSFNMDGVILGIDNYNGNVNSVSKNYVNWLFRRAPSFFDEVCYTGNSTAGTAITHNLVATPELLIVKCRSNASSSWRVLYQPTGIVGQLESTATVVTTNREFYFGDDTNYISPTSSVFTVASNSSVNTSGRTYVAYLFATCAGVSKVGSYTGTGTTKQIDCGFSGGARFVLIKRTDSTGDWYVWDTARGIVSGNDPYLLLNSTAAEVTGIDYIDTYSAGFEISSTAPSAINANGGSFIFLAIA